jgi:hypothetical protein
MNPLLMAGHALALLLAAAGAAAQSPQQPDRRVEPLRDPMELGRFADLDQWQWKAQRGRKPTEAERQVQDVVEAIGQRDCALAVKSLNAGLAKGAHEVLVLAATMYEEGLCLKPNWERAVALLQRAHGAGSPLAAPRLASGYAAPAGGGDKAAALWWAMQAKAGLPEVCRIAPALVADADKFVAAIEAWPAGRIDHCAYVAGVMATLQGQIETSALASVYALGGEVGLSLVPAIGRIDIVDRLAAAETGVGRINDASTERENRGALIALLRKTAERAIGRYTRPTGLDPSWIANFTFEFKPAA